MAEQLSVRNSQDTPQAKREPSAVRDFLEGRTPEEAVEKAKEHEEGDPQDIRQMFHKRDRDREQSRRHEQHGRYRKLKFCQLITILITGGRGPTYAVSETERGGRAKASDDGDGPDHEKPVDRSDVYLARGDRARVLDPDGGEGAHPDELVDEGEGPGDHGLALSADAHRDVSISPHLEKR